MIKKTVFAVEVFKDHWATVGGTTGLTREQARTIAVRMLADRVSVAEYELSEGSSAVRREELDRD